MKVGVVVVTHGQLATELLNAAEMIVGDLPHFAAVSIGWRQTAGGTPEAPAGALVLADMFGGTPANLGVTFLDANNVEVITGVNLAMLLKLARPQKDSDLLTLAREMREHGRNAIWVASDLLRGEKQQ
jgi:PTS system mannose-specific IIA component